MAQGTIFNAFSFLPFLMIVVYGLFALLGLYALFLFIRFMDRAIKALDIYIDEKRGRR